MEMTDNKRKENSLSLLLKVSLLTLQGRGDWQSVLPLDGCVQNKIFFSISLLQLVCLLILQGFGVALAKSLPSEFQGEYSLGVLLYAVILSSSAAFVFIMSVETVTFSTNAKVKRSNIEIFLN